MDLVAYIRVSRVGGREGDSFQSPRTQQQAIDAIVSLTPDARVVATFTDLDESGGTMDRPGVQKAIAMVDSGRADGIVCAYLDRWARNLEALQMIERWTREGKTFISAADKFDAKTSQGKFALGLMLLVAKYYRDVIADRWNNAVQDAVGRGVHVTVPYGYRRTAGRGKEHPKGGARGTPLIIEESESAVVRRIFAERLGGVGFAAIAQGLNADGIPSPGGGLWTRQAVNNLHRVKAYKGVASRGEHEKLDAHPAIIDPRDWAAAQRERGEARGSGSSLLRGLVRCAGCGYVMGAGSSKHGGRRYNCNRKHSELRCPSPTTAPADALEQMVTDGFLARFGDVSVQGASAADPRVAGAEAALTTARTELVDWRDDVSMRQALGDEDYRAGLLARKRHADEAERAYSDAIRAADTAGLSVDRDLWAEFTTAERRELLRSGLDAVVLSPAPSTHTPLAERVEVLWAGELDHDGTRSGIAASVRGRP